MGTWNIQINGCGSHDNKDFEGDADRLAVDFIALLKAHGQRIDLANFNLTDGEHRIISTKALMKDKKDGQT